MHLGIGSTANMRSDTIEMQSVGGLDRPPDGSRRTFWKNKVRSTVQFVKSIDDRVNKSTFGRIFRLGGSGHPEQIAGANFSTEIRAGLTTFATMAYIIAVNASILADSGFGCPCEFAEGEGMKCKDERAYKDCYNVVRLDLITATAAISGFASVLFGLLTNLPVALAPGMGLNAYFTFQVVGFRGSGATTHKVALTAVFIEGFIFLFLALTGMRHWLVRIIPSTIKTASGVGIGLFLTLIGMSYTSGIGLVSGAISTPLAIAGCPAESLTNNQECQGEIMTSPKMWLGIIGGGLLTAFLMAFRVKAALVYGIAFVSILSWPRNTSVTYFPDTEEGNARWAFFSKVVAFHPIEKTMLQQEWNLGGANASHIALSIFTFLYVDIIDCTATLYSMARFCNKVRKGDSDFPRSTVAYCTDAFCISIGALLGTSPVTAFIESGAGIAEGGRTGLTAIVAGLCFITSLFFAPIFASIPPWATGCTLVLVGCLMIRQVTKINWSYIGDAIPSFVTLVMIPFSYSVAYGLIAGLFIYTGLNGLIWVVIKLSGESIMPRDYELKQYWTWRPPGEKPWIIRIFSKRRHWGGHKDAEGEGDGGGRGAPDEGGERNKLRQNPGYPLASINSGAGSHISSTTADGDRRDRGHSGISSSTYETGGGGLSSPFHTYHHHEHHSHHAGEGGGGSGGGGGGGFGQRSSSPVASTVDEAEKYDDGVVGDLSAASGTTMMRRIPSPQPFRDIRSMM